MKYKNTTEEREIQPAKEARGMSNHPDSDKAKEAITSHPKNAFGFGNQASPGWSKTCILLQSTTLHGRFIPSGLRPLTGF